MKYVVDHDFHFHSQVSLCSRDPEQTNERILQYARENGLKKIIVTDHFWDENVEEENLIDFYKQQNFKHLSKSLPLPKSEIEFGFGCETDFSRKNILGVSKERFDEFEFIVVPTTHMHMMGFTIYEEDNTTEGRAKLWLNKLEALLSMDLPFHKIGIAHLACILIDRTSNEDKNKVLNLLKDKDLERVFAKAAKLGVGIELNACDFSVSLNDLEPVLRIFRIAKRQGCKFYLSSDAHHPNNFAGVKEIFEKVIDLLELTEDDKFYI